MRGGADMADGFLDTDNMSNNMFGAARLMP
jgi:hypothetical protein